MYMDVTKSDDSPLNATKSDDSPIVVNVDEEMIKKPRSAIP